MCVTYTVINKGQLDPCHYNFTKLDFMLKSMPLSGMIFNVKPNFTELWWHESNFPFLQPMPEDVRLVDFRVPCAQTWGWSLYLGYV